MIDNKTIHFGAGLNFAYNPASAGSSWKTWLHFLKPPEALVERECDVVLNTMRV